ncbi:hypothetical protein PIB30_080780 [Stylosanthes scabra]|uniref:CCT domain-containing protein n=1 Tax=Stylosanthes scabra TaxID=79078 RepID=A0ABU6VRM9_9FABA|nr:hypothetical protein [Stylosanthes scabra]
MVSDIPYSFGRNCSDSTGSDGRAMQLCGMDREARVLRYREKRKNYKFEKTIRYASRKAYAKTRPRIKGRFAKRIKIESVVDRLYCPAGGVLGWENFYERRANWCEGVGVLSADNTVRISATPVEEIRGSVGMGLHQVSGGKLIGLQVCRIGAA